MDSAKASIKLYSYYRSSCAGRVRIALRLKGLSYEYCTTNTEEGQQLSPEYRTLNPSASVPTLIVEKEGNSNAGLQSNTAVIGQSWAALVYLEEAFPGLRALLPDSSHPELRASVTELAMIIVADTQPVTNTRLFPLIDELGGDRTEWMKRWYHRGLKTYDTVAEKTAGRFSVGDEVTLADVCLAPAVWNAERAGMTLTEYPVVARVMKALEELPEVKAAHWRRQPDTPKSDKVA